MNSTGRSRKRIARRRSGGFTLVELLIVIIIIAVVIAIVFPALRGARDAARTAATKAMFGDLGSASGQFILDNRRAPGYFSPVEMGDVTNDARGFTGMENVMLDLAGGIVPGGGPGVGGGPPPPRVGPIAGREVSVDTSLIGATGSTKTYWMPDRKQFVLQNVAGQKSAIQDHLKLPDVTDPFGQPILAWTQDTTAPSNSEFAWESYNPGQPIKRAKFYWSSNAAFLKATSLGKLGANQVLATNSIPHSLLGRNVTTDISYSLEGVLGNPAYPKPQSNPCDRPVPAAARGSLVFHSAGMDGFYVGSGDRGGKFHAHNQRYLAPPPCGGPITGLVDYTVAYNIPLPAASAPQEDTMSKFDDILAKGDGSGG